MHTYMTCCTDGSEITREHQLLAQQSSSRCRGYELRRQQLYPTAHRSTVCRKTTSARKISMWALLCVSVWVSKVMTAFGQTLFCEDLPAPHLPNSTSADSYTWPDPYAGYLVPKEICFNSTCTVSDNPYVCAAVLDHSRRANCSNAVPCCMRKDRCVKSLSWDGKPGKRCEANTEAENGAHCMTFA
jgi:hypothetical protein